MNQIQNQAANEVLKIEIQHGSDRHPFILKGQNKTLTVLDLQKEIERVTSVPINDQRLYFKAKELNQTPQNTLKECQLENNHVVKLVGEPSKSNYSSFYGRTNHQQPNINSNSYLQQYPNQFQS